MILNSPLNVQIETGNYCNRKCHYCYWGHTDLPGWGHSNKPEVMDIVLYKKIISEIKTLGVQIQPIAFSAYNEPTIDPLFIDRLEIMKQNNLFYWNITNGTHLTPEILDYFMKNLDLIRRFFLINSPSINPEQYTNFGGGSPHQLTKVLDGLHRLGSLLKPNNIHANITILGKYDVNHENNVQEIKKVFEPYGYVITKAALHDRAGTLQPFVNNGINHVKVKDCYKFKGNLYFGLKGNLYLCCHDFHEVYSYGNINEKPLKEIIGSQLHMDTIEKIKSEICKKCVEATV